MTKMISISWDEKFVVGHERIDHEHLVFFDLIKNLSHLSNCDNSEERVNRLLTEVKKYADFHFCSEENIMIDLEYPDFAQHKNEHKMLLHELDSIIHEFKEREVQLTEIVLFMFRWFAAHTSNSDKKLSAYIKSKQF